MNSPTISPSTSLRLTGRQHAVLHAHLFPGDGNEAVALVLCGRRFGAPEDGPWGSRHVLTAYEIVPVPYDVCHERTPTLVSWPVEPFLDVFERAERLGLAVLKIHSHPGDYRAFSETDDASDAALFPSVMGWTDDPGPHGSAVMLPSGEVFARAAYDDGTGGARFVPVESVLVAGDDLRIFHRDIVCEGARGIIAGFAERTAQAFGEGTTAALARLSVGVVGASGTGSPIVEMLARLGIGEVVLVDPDLIEERNLNRILNATRGDIGRPKVGVLAKAVRRMGLGTRVVPIQSTLFDGEVVRRIALADVLFGCVDSVDGRDLMNRIATYYALPYFDVGVRLDADGRGGVDGVHGTVHYLQPGGSSLLSREAYSAAALRAAHLRRADPELYASQLKEKYVIGVQEDRPAVVSVNMFYAALAVTELLARLHPFRDDENRRFAQNGVSLSQSRFISETDGEPDLALAKLVGRGDTPLLLGMPEFSAMEARYAA
ncbi:MAG TPA: ThiF family adenylyltransferase [Rhodothermales bacterium]|nr:ThiF family adenylyltransferase [Rhodothermales bacterium]